MNNINQLKRKRVEEKHFRNNINFEENNKPIVNEAEQMKMNK